MSHLEGLVSSLQHIMDDQSVAMSDLRIQLQEIQDALNRVQNKREYMTKEERQVLQNAEMMKNLAEEVLSTKLVKDRPSSRSSNHSTTGIGGNIGGVDGGGGGVTVEKQQPSGPRISMALLAQAPMTPPPTATTPPPSNPFMVSDDTFPENGNIITTPPIPSTVVMPSSTSTSTSFTSQDSRPSYFGHAAHHGRGQYSDTSSATTSSSRPSSMISRSSSMKRYQNQHHHRTSFRGLDTLYSPSHPSGRHHQQHQNRNDYERESNAAFDRICSILNLLITDASSAVGKSPTEQGGNGGGVATAGAAPGGEDAGVTLPLLLTPLMVSDSDDHSTESATEDEEGETDEVHAEQDDSVTAAALPPSADTTDAADATTDSVIVEGGVGGGARTASGLAVMTTTTTATTTMESEIPQEMMGVIGRNSTTTTLSSRPSSRASILAGVRPRSRVSREHPKRLSSLFVEIQDAQLALEAAAAAAAEGEEEEKEEQQRQETSLVAGAGGRGRSSYQDGELRGHGNSSRSSSSRSSSTPSVHRHYRSRSFAAGVRLRNSTNGSASSGTSSCDDDGGVSEGRRRGGRGRNRVDVGNAEDLLDPAFASVDPPVIYPATTTTMASASASTIGRRWVTRSSRSYSTTAMSPSSSSLPKLSTISAMKQRSRVEVQTPPPLPSPSPLMEGQGQTQDQEQEQQQQQQQQQQQSEQEILVSFESGYLDGNSYHHRHDPFSTPFRRSSSSSSNNNNNLRRRASFPVRRSGGEDEWWQQHHQQQQQELEQQLQVAELEQVIQRVDTELDRTVETIDGLTRDLVAVATHQNWMQAKLQKSLQFQKLQLELIERGQYTQPPHHLHNHHEGENGGGGGGEEDEEADEDMAALLLDPTGTNSPMRDLSRSLRQVAVSVGRIMASNATILPTARVLGRQRRGSQGRRESGGRQQQQRQRAKTVSGHGGQTTTLYDGQDLSSSQEEGEQDEGMTASSPSLAGFSWSAAAGKDLTTQVLRRIEQSTTGLLGGRLGIRFAEGMEALGSRYSSASTPSSSLSSPVTETSGQDHRADDNDSDDDEEFEELDKAATTIMTNMRSSKRRAAHHDHDLQVGDGSASSSSTSSSTVLVPPPDFEDFVAQCRLLTRTLVLPFVQLTHHAMTSQDSSLALQPLRQHDQSQNYHHHHHRSTNSELEDEDQEDDHYYRRHRYDDQASASTVDGLDKATARWHSAATNTTTTTTTATTTELRVKRGSAMPTWPTTTFSDDNGAEYYGEESIGATAIPPDSMIRARTLVTTGLYLIHLMYWTVLFIVGTLVLDPYLAESSGRQVVRIVDQVRAAIGIEQQGAAVKVEALEGEEQQQQLEGRRMKRTARRQLVEDYQERHQQEQQQQQSTLFQSSGSASSSPIPSRRRNQHLASPSLVSVDSSLSSASLSSSSRGVRMDGRNLAQDLADETEETTESQLLPPQQQQHQQQEQEQEHEQQQPTTASNMEELASLELGLEEWIELSQEQQAQAQAQVQALEDKAIQVAVHFESLRQRLHHQQQYNHPRAAPFPNSRRSTPLSSTSTSRVNSRPNSMYFGTTTSTSSSLSTTSTLATLVGASQSSPSGHGTMLSSPSAGSFPSLVSLNGGQDEKGEQEEGKWKRLSATMSMSSLTRSSSFKSGGGGGKLDAALPVSPRSSMVATASPTSKVQHDRFTYRPKVSTTMAATTLSSSSPLTSPITMTPLVGGNGADGMGEARHRRLSPTLA